MLIIQTLLSLLSSQNNFILNIYFRKVSLTYKMAEALVITVLIICSLLLIGFICFYCHYHCCTCVQKRRKDGIVDLEWNDPNTAYLFGEISSCEICIWVCLFNKRMFSTTKAVYLTEGFKTFYNAMDNTTTSDFVNYSINDNCAICREEFLNNCEVVRLSCSHGYHKACLREWVEGKEVTNCPLCHYPIYSETVTFGEPLIERPLYHFAGKYERIL